MDGVLADFDSSANKIKNTDDNLNRAGEFLTKEQLRAKREMWRNIEGTEFYADLGILSGAEQMLDAAQKVAGATLYILSKSPGAKNFKTGINETERIARQKTEWVLSNLGKYFTPENIFITRSGGKADFVRPALSDVLIDDRVEIIDEWRAAGGTGIHYTSATGVVKDLEKL